MNECTFLIFGGTGDLTKRKLIPALYKLIQDKKIEKFAVIGAAIDAATPAEFIDRARYFVQNIDETIWQKLKNNSYYHEVNFGKPADFDSLARFVEKIENEKDLPGNRIVYMAIPSLFYCDVTEQVGRTGIVKKQLPQNIWQRLVYEKPFGLDLASAKQINGCINKWFDEKQIYRIDHYLTKELVSNITLVRFTNIIFEPLWNNKYIDYVQIVLNESIGLEGRGKYYDKYGVLKDIVQNHGLQLLSLIAMELPDQLRPDTIRDRKADVLKHVAPTDGFLGQYINYHAEPDVEPASKTATFACLRFLVDVPRWKNVPFYIKAGKKLDKKNTSIHIKFKDVTCDVTPYCIYQSDYLTIQIDPDASFSLQLNTKKPGPTYDVTPVQLTFSQNYVFGAQTPEAYELLLEQIILGDQSISVRFDEIEYSWNIIEKIEQMRLPEYQYQPNSFGPIQLEQFAKTYNLGWRA